MKKYIYILIAVLCTLLYSCKEELDQTNLNVEGLKGFYISVPGNPTSYSISNKGELKDGDTLLIKVPSPEGNPVDLTKLLPKASLGHNAILSPALAGITSFKEPLDIYITDLNKNTKHYVVKVELIPPKMVFQQLWYKNMLELGITNGNDWHSIAVSKDILLMCSYGKLRLYNKADGTFIKQMNSGHPWSTQVNTDDEGTVVTTSWGIYGSWFECKKVDLETETVTMLGYIQRNEVPEYMGEKVTLTGNVTTGSAFIVATSPNDNAYYMLELKNGTKVSPTPAVRNLTPFTEKKWRKGTVKRKTTEENSEFIASGFFAKNAGDANTDESRLVKIKNRLQYVEMATEALPASVLDFDYFKLDGEEYIAMAAQQSQGSPVEMRIYNITKDEYLELTPVETNFGDLLYYTSPSINIGGSYYGRYADVSVQMTNDGALVFLYTGSPNGVAGGGVAAYMMTYTPQY